MVKHNYEESIFKICFILCLLIKNWLPISTVGSLQFCPSYVEVECGNFIDLTAFFFLNYFLILLTVLCIFFKLLIMSILSYIHSHREFILYFVEILKAKYLESQCRKRPCKKNPVSSLPAFHLSKMWFVIVILFSHHCLSQKRDLSSPCALKN